MITRLTGKLIEKRPPTLVLDVSGVGYELEAPMTTCVALPEIGKTVQLYTHLVVRENAHLLYGFVAQAERNVFRLLITISGVGPKMALIILSGMSVTEFKQCVDAQDPDFLVQLPGIGRKTAERLLIDVRDRLLDIVTPPAGSPTITIRHEAQKALEALGYSSAQAKRLVQDSWDKGMSLEEVIMVALRKMT